MSRMETPDKILQRKRKKVIMVPTIKGEHQTGNNRLRLKNIHSIKVYFNISMSSVKEVLAKFGKWS